MFLPSSFPSSSSALLASLASMMMRRAAHRWGLVDEPFILALAALLLLPVAAAPAPQAVEEGFPQPQMGPKPQVVQQQPMGPSQQQQMGLSQLGQPPTGLDHPKQPQQPRPPRFRRTGARPCSKKRAGQMACQLATCYHPGPI